MAERVALVARGRIGHQDLAARRSRAARRRAPVSSIAAAAARSAGSTRWPAADGDPQELLGRLGELGDRGPAARRAASAAARVGRRRRRRRGAPRRRTRCRPSARGSIRRARRPSSWPAIARSCAADSRRRTAAARGARPGRLRSELGEERQQRVAPVQLVGAVREDQHDRRVRAGCAPGTRAGRASNGPTSGGPRRRTGRELGREPLEHAEERARTAGPGPTGCSCSIRTRRRRRSSGDGPRSGTSRASSERPWPSDRLQLLGSRSAGRARAGPRRPAHTAGPLHRGRCSRRRTTAPSRRASRCELRDEPRLADAGLARDERRAAPASPGELEAARSRSTSTERPIEDGARDAGGHAVDYRPIPAVPIGRSRDVLRGDRGHHRSGGFGPPRGPAGQCDGQSCPPRASPSRLAHARPQEPPGRRRLMLFAQPLLRPEPHFEFGHLVWCPSPVRAVCPMPPDSG